MHTSACVHACSRMRAFMFACGVCVRAWMHMCAQVICVLAQACVCICACIGAFTNVCVHLCNSARVCTAVRAFARGWVFASVGPVGVHACVHPRVCGRVSACVFAQ